MIKLNLPKQTIEKLQTLTETIRYDFLGFTLDLQKSVITDNFGQAAKNYSEWHIQLLSTLLAHYSTANPVPLSGKLVKFKDLPGGYAYEGAFIKRAIQPIAEVFGGNPQELHRAAALLGGKPLNLGDASVEIIALKGIPLTVILWGAEEYPASASILYDQSASNYLPTEDIAVLGELTTNRLIKKQNLLVGH